MSDAALREKLGTIIRKFGRAALLALVLAGGAVAEPLPALFHVVGVGSADVLNVRAGPSAATPVLATLAAGATGVEVVGLDAGGGWGQVNAGEGSGWVAMRYLAAERAGWELGRLPEHLACFGTEPFWSVRVEGAELVWSTPEGEERYGFESRATGAPTDARRALVAGGTLTATISPAACSDGMSDRAFGLEALVVRAGEPRLLAGCCSVTPR